MAIIAIFELTGMTQQQYDQTIQDLDAAGLGTPNGRVYHTASKADPGTLIIDVWESEELLGKFAESLIPILTATGATPVEPRILPIHNIIAP